MTNKDVKELSRKEAREYLKSLYLEIIKIQPINSKVYGEGTILRDNRNLTQKEIDKIFSLAERQEFAVYIISSHFGFKFSVYISDGNETLIAFVSNQIPHAKNSVEKAYSLVIGIINSESNLSLLDKFNLPKPQPVDAYIY